MKSVLFLGLLFLAGCASVSEYRQGCEDGVNQLAFQHKITVNPKAVKNHCEAVEKLHKAEKETKNIGGRGRDI